MVDMDGNLCKKKRMVERMLEIFSAAANALGIPLGDGELSLFTTYYRELITWNEKISLVSLKSDFDIPIKHFVDSLTLVPFMKHTSGQILDMGSGAGFPGIPVKIVLKSLTMFLLESSRKKSSFLKHTIRSLQLTDIHVIHNRAERLMKDETYQGRFEAVISRATFKLPQFLQMGAYFLSPQGILIAMKGKKSDDEIKEVNYRTQDMGLKHVSTNDITLPITGDFRRIIIYEKRP
jgi:16S rRNA (guanine527-N7)-methyltransferase